MRSKEHIIESPDKRYLTVQHPVFENTEQFGRKLSLIDTVIVVKSCLGSPADMKDTGNMFVCPV